MVVTGNPETMIVNVPVMTSFQSSVLQSFVNVYKVIAVKQQVEFSSIFPAHRQRLHFYQLRHQSNFFSSSISCFTFTA